MWQSRYRSIYSDVEQWKNSIDKLTKSVSHLRKDNKRLEEDLSHSNRQLVREKHEKKKVSKELLVLQQLYAQQKEEKAELNVTIQKYVAREQLFLAAEALQTHVTELTSENNAHLERQRSLKEEWREKLEKLESELAAAKSAASIQKSSDESSVMRLKAEVDSMQAGLKDETSQRMELQRNATLREEEFAIVKKSYDSVKAELKIEKERITKILGQHEELQEKWRVATGKVKLGESAQEECNAWRKVAAAFARERMKEQLEDSGLDSATIAQRLAAEEKDNEESSAAATANAQDIRPESLWDALEYLQAQKSDVQFLLGTIEEKEKNFAGLEAELERVTVEVKASVEWKAQAEVLETKLEELSAQDERATSIIHQWQAFWEECLAILKLPHTPRSPTQLNSLTLIPTRELRQSALEWLTLLMENHAAYEQASAHLKSMSAEVRTLQDRVQGLEEQNMFLSSELSTKVEEIGEFEVEVERLMEKEKNSFTAMQEETSQLQRELANQRELVEMGEESMEILASELEEKTNELEALHVELTSLRTMQESQAELLANSEEECGELKAKLQQVVEEQVRMERERQQFVEQLDVFEERVQSLQLHGDDQLQQREAALAEAERNLQAEREQREHWQERLQAMSTLRDEALAGLQLAHRQLDDLTVLLAKEREKSKVTVVAANRNWHDLSSPPREDEEEEKHANASANAEVEVVEDADSQELVPTTVPSPITSAVSDHENGKEALRVSETETSSPPMTEVGVASPMDDMAVGNENASPATATATSSPDHAGSANHTNHNSPESFGASPIEAVSPLTSWSPPQ